MIQEERGCNRVVLSRLLSSSRVDSALVSTLEETEVSPFHHFATHALKFSFGGVGRKTACRCCIDVGCCLINAHLRWGRHELPVPSISFFFFFFQFLFTNTKSCSVVLNLYTIALSPALPALSSCLGHRKGRGGGVKRAWVGSCQMAGLIIVFNYVAKLPRQLGSHQPCRRRVSGGECHTHIDATSVVIGVHAHSRSISSSRFVRAHRLQDVTGGVKTCTEGPSALFFY